MGCKESHQTNKTKIEPNWESSIDTTCLHRPSARMHLPAFHALKAWRLAVMVSSTSLFHHQVSRHHRWGFVVPHTSSVVFSKPVLVLPRFPQYSSSLFSFHMCLEDFLETATRLRIFELPHFWTWGEFALDLRRHINHHVAHKELMLQSNLLSRNHLHIHNKFVQAFFEITQSLIWVAVLPDLYVIR